MDRDKEGIGSFLLLISIMSICLLFFCQSIKIYLLLIIPFQTSDEYKWSDASTMSYYNWLTNQNMSSTEERCAILDTDRYECTDTCEYPDGNWIVTPCTETHPYMCKAKKGLFRII